eukprot:TRINITY_DN22497_c0_g1_i1.p1 TRINITY_DN22497_c0_g1~~TRINITY_DN22497_c0_g1_i1.p1  ORF type:complete len:629 (-),score=86.01 TRINITY_DN22497_c0_g1_i1:88-1950(-)
MEQAGPVAAPAGDDRRRQVRNPGGMRGREGRVDYSVPSRPTPGFWDCIFREIRGLLASVLRALAPSEPSTPTPAAALASVSIGVAFLLVGLCIGSVIATLISLICNDDSDRTAAKDATTTGGAVGRLVAGSAGVGTGVAIDASGLIDTQTCPAAILGFLPRGMDFGVVAGFCVGLLLGGSFSNSGGIAISGVAVGAVPPCTSSSVAFVHKSLSRLRITASRLAHDTDALAMFAFGAAGTIVISTITFGADAGAGVVMGVAAGSAFATVISGNAVLLVLGVFFPMSIVYGSSSACAVGTWFGGIVGLQLWVRWAQDLLLYHPRRYSDNGSSLIGPQLMGDRLYVVEKVDYTFQGLIVGELAQSALLLRPQDQRAEVVWVTFGGNAMLATDWFYFLAGLLRLGGPTGLSAAFLLVDYPGYGWNAGRPGPAAVLESSRNALRAGLARLAAVASDDGANASPPPEVHLFGHSLGAAAASQLALKLAQEGCRTGCLVISAPFLSVPHMAECILCGVPPPGGGFSSTRPFLWLLLRLFVPHRWNNAAVVPAAAKAGWRLGVVHGVKDALVPVTMGRELRHLAEKAASASGLENNTVLIEVPAAAHNDVLAIALREYAALMGFAAGA